MWELDHKENWVSKNWCFWTVVLEKNLQSSLDSKEIQPVHPKGNQSWIFIGRTDAEAETPILWPHDVKNWLIWKDPDAGKDWRREEKGMTSEKMVGWHYWLDGHEFEQAPGAGDEQGSLGCCSPWGHKESDITKWLTWTEQFLRVQFSVKCIHTFLQPISRIFPVLQNWNSVPNKPSSPSLSLQSLATNILLSVFINLTALGFSYKELYSIHSFCFWLISLNMMSSRLYYRLEFSFFLRLNNNISL